MIREEEKNKERFEYVSKRLANPELYVNSRSHENGYKEAIDKACEWLERALPLRPDDRDEFIDQFKEAMKGE